MQLVGCELSFALKEVCSLEKTKTAVTPGLDCRHRTCLAFQKALMIVMMAIDAVPARPQHLEKFHHHFQLQDLKREIECNYQSTHDEADR